MIFQLASAVQAAKTPTALTDMYQVRPEHIQTLALITDRSVGTTTPGLFEQLFDSIPQSTLFQTIIMLLITIFLLMYCIIAVSIAAGQLDNFEEVVRPEDDEYWPTHFAWWILKCLSDIMRR